MTGKELVAGLRKGLLSINRLSGDEFQDAVFQLIVEYYSLGGQAVQISDYPVGEIDVVIEVRVQAPSYSQIKVRSDLHFVECKHYRRKLELDTVAKVYCAAIAHQPRSLTIVSSSPLAPQAVDYACKFFDTGSDEKNGLFRSILFEHLTLERLLGFDSFENYKKNKARVFRRSHISLVTWIFLEHKGIGSRVIARSEDTLEALRLRRSCRYELRLVVHDPQNDMVDVKIVERYSGEKKGFLLDSSSTVGSEIILAFKVDTSIMSLEGEPVFLQVKGRFKTRRLVGPINLPRCSLERDVNFLSDLRATKTAQFSEFLRQTDSSRLIFLHGEAGIGKTYFVEAVCDQLAAQHGWKNVRVTAGADSEAGLFLKLIWPILGSSFGAGRPGVNQFETRILQEFLSSCLKNLGEKDAEQIAENLLGPGISDAELDSITYLSARLLSDDTSPHLLLISNCHAISPRLMRVLQSFALALDDLGWGGIRLILEYRDEPGEASDSWSSVLQALRSTLPSKTLDFRLGPIAESELQQGLEELLADEGDSSIANLLLRKAGGNPLFLNQILLHARERGFLIELPLHLFRWRFLVTDRNGLARELDCLPETVSALLERRVRFLLRSETSGAGYTNQDLIFYLAIASVVGYEIDETHIQRGSEISSSFLLDIRFDLIEAGVLRPSLDSPPAVFVHEFMWLAVRDVVGTLPIGRRALRQLEVTLKTETIGDTLIGGRINALLADLARAEHWFNLGWELARGKGDYIAQRSCLTGLRTVLKKETDPGPQTLRRLLRVEQDLGWNEIMTGSQVNALTILRDIIEATASRRVELALDCDEVDSIRAGTYTKILTLLARKRAPSDFMEACKAAAARVRSTPELAWIITRFVTFSGAANFPKICWRAAQLVQALTSELDDPDFRSVILHDTGDLYLAEQPLVAEEFFRKALSCARERRQSMACSLTLNIALLHGRGQMLSRDSRESITSEIESTGVENLNIRWLLYCGIAAQAEGSTTEALHCFRKASDRSLLANLDLHLWESHNNIALVLLEQGDLDRAVRHLELALARIQPLIEFSTHGQGATEEVMEYLYQRTEVFLDVRTLRRLCQNSTLPRPPKLSGSICTLLYNIATLSRALPRLRIKSLPFQQEFSKRRYPIAGLSVPSSPMVVQWNRQRLLFSIE